MAVYVGAVHGFVAAGVSFDDGAAEADSSEDAFAARVGEDFGVEGEIGIGGCLSADRSCSHRCIGAELELVVEQAVQGAVIHEEQHEVGGRAADLITDAAAFHGEEDGRAPAMGGAARGHSPAVVSSEDKGELGISGDDGDAFGFTEQIVGNASVGGLHDFAEDLCGAVGAADVVTAIGGECDGGDEKCKGGEENKTLQHLFHAF